MSSLVPVERQARRYCSTAVTLRGWLGDSVITAHNLLYAPGFLRREGTATLKSQNGSDMAATAQQSHHTLTAVL